MSPRRSQTQKKPSPPNDPAISTRKLPGGLAKNEYTFSTVDLRRVRVLIISAMTSSTAATLRRLGKRAHAFLMSESSLITATTCPFLLAKAAAAYIDIASGNSFRFSPVPNGGVVAK